MPEITLISVLFENSLWGNSVFLAKFFPELESDLVAALPQLEHNHFARHFGDFCDFPSKNFSCCCLVKAVESYNRFFQF